MQYLLMGQLLLHLTKQKQFTMKKFILACMTFAGFIASAQAQSKEILVNKIAEADAWSSAKMIENYVTLNVSEEMYTKIMQSKTNLDWGTFASLGNDISAYSDKLHGSFINKNCHNTAANIKETLRAECEQEVQKMKGKLSITLNAQNLKLTEASYKLTMICMSYVGSFLDADYGSIDGVKGGWRPKGQTLSIIINPIYSTALPTVKWNTDGTVATITMPVESETPLYTDAILKGLMRGGIKN